ncbi:hypothetical protein DAEQUDRAFT_679385 [Daedalea quercina L-15889]|uniref:Uncharacterized protein n=1 Tax=Daedalea quercina L-15889 TaxID=1314783 RepID=A0A165L5Z1_9APHY|nr:hypothetical protein DAEQUDRAFT_679385 [Daedalea quercina L-15889]
MTFLRTRLWTPRDSSLARYATPEEEEEYWNRTIEARRRLYASNANSTAANIPLVQFYVPKLLPPYRGSAGRRALDNAEEYMISAKTFCKWHHMVFCGPLHPTLKKADKLMRNYSSRDRREMRRIARMLTDEEVFARKNPWTPVYRDIWRRWLETKGPDIVISFE